MLTGRDSQILIVGAGPTGLMLGCELARRGVAPRVVDKASGPDPRSKAVGLHARSLEILDELELAEPGLAQGVRVHRLDVRDGEHLHARLDFGLADSAHTYVLDLPQHRTESLLRERLKKYGVAVEWGTELTRLDSRDDCVDVELRKGERSEFVSAGWVCGCDGIASSVRTLSGIAFEGGELPEGWLLVEGSLDWDLSPGAWHLFMGRHGVLVVCPLPGGAYRMAADIAHVAGDPPAIPTHEEFQDLLWQRAGPRVHLREIAWASPFRIHERLASTFTAGHVLVAGDAAHVQSPSAGQGLNTGLQDAWNVGWKLALVARGQAPQRLLDSYDAERRQIARGSISFTHAATRLGELHGPGVELLRDAAEELAARIPGFFRWLIDRMAEVHLGYAGSPIVLDRLHRGLGHTHRAHAGERMPDVLLPSAGRRLYDVLRGRDHVLLLPAETEHELPVGTRLETVRLAANDAAVVAARLGHPDPTWVVVRPDRYVGYTGRAGDIDGLSAYERLIFSDA